MNGTNPHGRISRSVGSGGERSFAPHGRVARLVAVCLLGAWSLHGEPPRPDAALPLQELPQQPLPGSPYEPQPMEPDIRRVYEEALRLRANRRIEEALRTLQLGANFTGGGHPLVQTELAELALLAGRFAQAREYAASACRAAPASPRAWYIAAKAADGLDQVESAREKFLHAARLSAKEPSDPHGTAAWFELAGVLERDGYLRAAAEALTAFEQALTTTSPEHRFVPPISSYPHWALDNLLERRLELLRKAGDTAGALSAAEDAVQADPADPGAARLFVEQLLASGRLAEVVAICRRWAPFERSDAATTATAVQFIEPLLRGLQAGGQLDEAVRDWIAIIRRGAGNGLMPVVAARLEDLGEFAAAAGLWHALAETRGGDEFLGRRAWIAEILSGETASIPAAWAAAGATPLALGRLAALAREPRLARRPERVHAALQTLDAAPGGRADDVVVRSSLLIATGDLDAASRELAALEPAPEALALRGELALAQFEWDAALAAVAALPPSSATLFIQARAEFGLGRADAAAATLRRALQRAPQDPELLGWLARVYAEEAPRELLKAQRYYQEAFEAAPYDSEAAEMAVSAYLADDPPKIDLAAGVLQRAEAGWTTRAARARMDVEVRFATRRFTDGHVAALAALYRAQPGEVAAAVNLLKARLIRQELAEATAVWQQLPGWARREERGQRLQIELEIQRLEFGAAAERAGKLAQRYPQRPLERQRWAELLLADFQVDAGFEQLRRVAAAATPDERQTEQRDLLIRLLLDFQKPEEALALLDDWIATDPERAFGWTQRRAEALIYAGRVEAGLAEIQRLMDADQDNVGLRLLYSELGARAHRLDLVEAALRGWRASAQQRGEDVRDLTQQLAEVLLAQDRPAEAVELLNDIRRGGAPGDPEAFDFAPEIEWARALCLAGRLDEACAAFEKMLQAPFIQADPRLLAYLRTRLVNALAEAHAVDRGLEYLANWQSAPGNRPDPADAAVWRLTLLQAARDTVAYLDALRAVHALNPRNPGIGNDLGYSLADQGQALEEAAEMIRIAVASAPLRAAYLDSFAWVRYKQGRFEEAETYLRRATRLREGQDAIIFDHLGDVLSRRGERAGASQAWRKAQELTQLPGAKPTLEAEPELVPRIEAKLRAVQAGQDPPIAPLGSEVQP